jgi:hypothetical protein
MPRAGSSRSPADLGHAATDADACHDARVDPKEPPEGIAFDPVRLGPARRRVDRVGLVAIVIGLGLVAAVAKPWAGAPSPAVVQASPSWDASVARSAAPAPPSVPAPRIQQFVASRAKILGAIDPHDAWGVRAVVRGQAGPGNPNGPEYTERWARAVKRPDGSRLALLGTGDESVVALGVTAPAAETPVDIRVWRPTEAGDWESLDVRSLADTTGDVLLGPPPGDRLALETWPAGAYRIELLVGARSAVIDVRLPGRFDRVPQPPPTKPAPDG